MIIIAIVALALLNRSLDVTQNLIRFNMNAIIAKHTLNKIYASNANLLLANTGNAALSSEEIFRELAVLRSGMDELGTTNIILDAIIKDTLLGNHVETLSDTSLISLNFSTGVTKSFRLLESLNLISSNILPFSSPSDIQSNNTNSQFLLTNPPNKLTSQLTTTNTQVQTYASKVFSSLKLTTLLTSLISVFVGLLAFFLSALTTHKAYGLLEEQTTIAYGFNGEDCALLRDNCEQILGVVAEARDRIAKRNDGASNPGSHGIFGIGQEDGFRLDTNTDEKGGEFVDGGADTITRKKKGNLSKFAKYDMMIHLLYMAISVFLGWLIYLSMRSPFDEAIESHNLLSGVLNPPIELAGHANVIKAYLVNQLVGTKYLYSEQNPADILADRTKQGIRDKVTAFYQGLMAKQGFFQSAESNTGDSGFVEILTTGDVCQAFLRRRGKYISTTVTGLLKCADVVQAVQMDGGANKGINAFMSAYAQWVSTLQTAVYLALNSGKETPIPSLESCALTASPSAAAFAAQMKCIISSDMYKSLGK